MNLIVDIGNTTAKLAIFDGKELKTVSITSNRSLDSLPDIVGRYTPDKGIVSTVVGMSETVRSQLERLTFKPIIFGPNTPIPITNLYGTPETLGSDRLAAVIGAQGIFPDRDILIIDAGTALTYEFIDRKGQYHGGNISPGLQMRLNALHQYTDRLPLVEAEGNTPLIGTDTDTAIRSGVIQGIRLEISGYISLLKKNYPKLLIFLTGGNEISFDTSIKNSIFADKFLVLKGLNRILNYNDPII